MTKLALSNTRALVLRSSLGPFKDALSLLESFLPYNKRLFAKQDSSFGKHSSSCQSVIRMLGLVSYESDDENGAENMDVDEPAGDASNEVFALNDALRQAEGSIGWLTCQTLGCAPRFNSG